MLETLKEIVKSYLSMQEELVSPASQADPKAMMNINKKLKSMEKSYELGKQYIAATNNFEEAKAILNSESDADMIELAKEQMNSAEKIIQELEPQIKVALLPKDPNDENNIFLEIRPAAWWDEAGLFAAELLRMYLMYAQKRWRKTEIVENTVSDNWWLKFAMVKMSWESVYSIMKFESWVHRVQRIPDTESNWRVHTSTVTVAIMPEVDDVEVNIDPNDIVMDTYAASSAWWQNANKNQTWVRLHHKPTWLIVNIWDTKSQLQNKERAFAVLKSRLYQIELDKKTAESREIRWNQIWSWDRSEKIRTYNFPQDRLTDHRIKNSWSNLPWILNWEIDDIINDLVIYNQEQLMSKISWGE